MCRGGGLNISEFSSLLPAHLLHAMLDSHSFQQEKTSPIKSGGATSTPFRLSLYKFPCSSRSWIPSIAHYPPHDWIDSLQVTAKAAKWDDAATAIKLWDKQLLLLYPICTLGVLEILRVWLLCIA
jgi:hypothetical protein